MTCYAEKKSPYRYLNNTSKLTQEHPSHEQIKVTPGFRSNAIHHNHNYYPDDRSNDGHRCSGA